MSDERNLQAKCLKAMSLSKKIEMALHHAGLELTKKDNRKENIGMHACLALAIQLRRILKSDPED